MNNQINNNLNDNPYKNYLPKNRVENEGGLFSPRILKTGLYVFYFIVFLIICGIVLHFKGYDILKSDVRSYNMNLAETIDLDAIRLFSLIVIPNRIGSTILNKILSTPPTKIHSIESCFICSINPALFKDL